MSATLKHKIAQLPDAPGVYVFKDSRGQILYVGKAKSLKRRVQSYLSRLLSAKTQAMVAKIADLEYRLTSSESQAQLLEAALIKEKQPPYNISLKDDKSFPWIRITREEFPVVSVCRRKKPQAGDTAVYFGPYTNAGYLRQAIKIIRRILGFRSCRVMPKFACLYGKIHLCPAPCVGRIGSADYKEIIKNITLILNAQYDTLLERLSCRMRELAGRQQFEEAACIRDQVYALSALTQDKKQPYGIDALEGLRLLLRLERLPRRIEAFDISNISGKQACGSMVSFWQGLPDKKNYRRFRIRTVEAIDDYGMIREVVHRRYTRLLEERLPLPDLVLIDGGKAHLAAAQEEITKLGIDLPLASIAKEKEHIYTRHAPGPLRLGHDEPALNLIRRVRDEAHRFALSYHHILRRKKTLGA
ncbi:MAG TPA: excinuclease ABC subunit UvrC [Patescibacteria group bacterium]|nr:excinuclease ABC subunit UvrC [Patescibacteria group bacterium]